mgnify:CR=1 FL=1
MTAGKIRIMPYKYNLRCSVPGCKNKGDFEIKRRPGNLMIMCEACMCGISEFIKDMEAAKAEMPTGAEAAAESVEETTEAVQEAEAIEAPKTTKRTRSRKEK